MRIFNLITDTTEITINCEIMDGSSGNMKYLLVDWFSIVDELNMRLIALACRKQKPIPFAAIYVCLPFIQFMEGAMLVHCLTL